MEFPYSEVSQAVSVLVSAILHLHPLREGHHQGDARRVLTSNSTEVTASSVLHAEDREVDLKRLLKVRPRSLELYFKIIGCRGRGGGVFSMY